MWGGRGGGGGGGGGIKGEFFRLGCSKKKFEYKVLSTKECSTTMHCLEYVKDGSTITLVVRVWLYGCMVSLWYVGPYIVIG